MGHVENLQEVGELKLNTDALFKRGFGASIVGIIRDDISWEIESPLWCYREQCEC